MLNLARPLAFFDLETTGLDIAKDRIVEISILKIDVDKNPALSETYAIRSVPTLMLFQNGKTLWRQSGVPTAAELEKVISMHRQKV